MNQPDKLDLKSMDRNEDQLKKLKQVLPEIFTEGMKVDFDKLRQTLGDAVDTDTEKFDMQWPGKSECFQTIQQPSIGTLKPCEEESANWNDTENLFIEGDNLEVLKLRIPEADKIKCGFKHFEAIDVDYDVAINAEEIG